MSMDHDTAVAVVRNALVEVLASEWWERQMRQVVKETTLLTLLEQEHNRDVRAAAVFLRECRLRGITVRLDENGEPRISESIKAHAALHAVLMCHRDAIYDELARGSRKPALKVNPAG